MLCHGEAGCKDGQLGPESQQEVKPEVKGSPVLLSVIRERQLVAASLPLREERNVFGGGGGWNKGLWA